MSDQVSKRMDRGNSMNSTALSLLVFVSIGAFGQTGPPVREEASHPPLSVVADALYCMEGEKTDANTAAKDKPAYRIKFIYGVVDPKVDAPNELHLISYNQDMKSAWLYELLLEHGVDSGITL